MSNLTLRGNASGSGTFIVESPNSNISRTITLPDQTATLATTTDSITQTQLETALNVTGSAPMFACRAWVNFNGIGTVAIRASGNVSSITDNGTGDYTVNFTTAMPDANYATVGTASDSGNRLTFNRASSLAAQATTSVRVTIGTPSGGAVDPSEVHVAIFR